MDSEATQTEPKHIRRKLADAYRTEATNTRWKKKDRAAFALMADSWERTLKKESLK